MIEDAIREITQALQKADGRIAYVYVRPSIRAHQIKPVTPGDADIPFCRLKEGLRLVHKLGLSCQ